MSGDLWYDFNKISYSNYTTCIRSNNLNLIKQSIIDTFKEEGYRSIAKPQLPQNSKQLIQKILSSHWEVDSFLCVIGLYSGYFGWTILKSSIFNLFGQKAKNMSCPLLSKLAIKASCEAFYHVVIERDWGLLLEADICGNIKASGYIESEYLEDLKFARDIIITSNNNQNFSLIEVPEEFQKAGTTKIFLSEKEKQKREKELEILYEQGEQEIRNRAWAEWKELNMSDFERMDEDLCKLICKSNSFWHENNLLYKAYTEPEKLEQNGVKLLFFQTGKFDLDPKTEEIWSPITKKKDYGIEREIPF
jgi:hypothetical protein